MNAKNPKFAAWALLPVALLALTSCAKTPKGTGEAEVFETPDGAARIETYQITATVTAVDAAKHRMTLQTPDGAKMNVKATKDVNLDPIKVGDRVTATVGEELAVFLRKSSAPPSAGEASAVALATAGADRAMFMADTMEVTARVTKVDMKHRKVTLQFADGKTNTMRVGKAVNLAEVQVGDAVTVRVSESLAVNVQKP